MLKKTMLFLTFAAAAGCAAAPPPVDRNASSEAALRGAREVGAEGVPRAALFLKLSEDEIAKSKVLLSEGDAVQSDLMLQRARADAELALALTREAAAEAETKALTAQLEGLRVRK